MRSRRSRRIGWPWLEAQERIELALAANGSVVPVAGNHDSLRRQGQQLVVDGAKDLAGVAAWQVGAADAIAEQGVAGDELSFRREPEAYAALSVTGGVKHVELGGAHNDAVAIFDGD